MERSLIRQVTQKGMQARLSTRHVKEMFYPNFFGVKHVSSLKWETLAGEKGAPVIADVVSFDSSAPQKSREVISKLSGDIPKISVKRGMNESDYNEYNNLTRLAQGDSKQLEILNLAYKDQDFVYNAVRGRMEWLCMQMMSRGGVHLSADNNQGIVTAEFVSSGIPNDNKKHSSVDWDNATKADGLQDIEDVLVEASGKGVTIRYVVMHTADFTLLKKQKSTIERIKGWINNTSKVIITKEIINDYLSAQEIPVKIVTVSPALRIEDKAHKRTTVNPWMRKRICFLEDLNVGDVQHGPIAAESSESIRKKALMVKQDYVLISKFSTEEPFKEWTKAEANAWPVLNDPDAIFLLKVDGSQWAENEDTESTDSIPALFLGEDVPNENNQVKE